jgi:hypothetical protein
MIFVVSLKAIVGAVIVISFLVTLSRYPQFIWSLIVYFVAIFMVYLVIALVVTKLQEER